MLDSSVPSRTLILSRRSLLVVVFVAVLIILAGWWATSAEVTASASSPDGSYCAKVVDRSFRFIDRNFQVLIEAGDGTTRVVFRSPDEPVSGLGHEQLLWSADGKRLLLVGKFWVRDGAEIADGACLYLLCDAASGQVWCNSDQQVAPGFGQGELEGFDLSVLGL